MFKPETAILACSGIIYRNSLSALIKAPMTFFDTTPIGRILNRFSKVTMACTCHALILSMSLGGLIGTGRTYPLLRLRSCIVLSRHARQQSHLTAAGHRCVWTWQCLLSTT